MPEEICEIIRNANGFPVLAHPGWSFRNGNVDLKEALREFQKMGISGVECTHPTHSKKMSVMLENWCEAHDLMITGGSDYHGEFSDNNQLMRIPIDKLSIDPMLDRI